MLWMRKGVGRRKSRTKKELDEEGVERRRSWTKKELDEEGVGTKKESGRIRSRDEWSRLSNSLRARGSMKGM